MIRLRFLGVIRLLFLTSNLYLNGVVRHGSKNGHHKDTCLKEIGSHFHIIFC